MDPLQIDENLSDLRQPYLLLTFSGWSDAAGVATAAGRFLVEHLEAERIAQIDPEDFYSFADQRPQAQYNDNNEREIIWPANEFFLSRQPQLEHDVIIGVGVEPHLKWRTFTDVMMDLTQRCKVFQTVTLGALWADVLYSAPVRFSGSATDPDLSRTLGLGTGSRYEGPTGMIGVLHDKLRRNQFTSASLVGQHAVLHFRDAEPQGHARAGAGAAWRSSGCRRTFRTSKRRRGSLKNGSPRPFPRTPRSPPT